MPFGSAAGAITAAVGAMIVFGLTNTSLLPAPLPQTAARPSFRLPDEAPGIDGIVRALISVFEQADVVGLGEAHAQRGAGV